MVDIYICCYTHENNNKEKNHVSYQMLNATTVSLSDMEKGQLGRNLPTHCVLVAPENESKNSHPKNTYTDNKGKEATTMAS